LNASEQKIVSDPKQLDTRLDQLHRPLVFTNGCFDILHRGHVAYLEEARALGASLMIGVNTDNSMRLLDKGDGRPINPAEDRMAVLAGLACVDLVAPFDDDTPLALIKRVHPEVLVKGGDWPVDRIVGADEVQSYGGTVHTIPIRYPRSTSDLIERIRT